MKTTFKFSKTVMAVAGAAAIMVATLGVTLMSSSTAQAQSREIWHGSYYCEQDGDYTCLPWYEVLA